METAIALAAVAAASATAAKYGYDAFFKKDAKVEPPFPRVLREVPTSNNQCRWLRLKKVHYADDTGRVREWEKAERTTRREGVEIDGVMVVARIVGGSRDGCVPFVSQFRPPVGRKTLELPAGLVDVGESVETAALRELKEETGFSGKVVSVSPVLFLDPGMSAACMRCVTVEVDGTLPENAQPRQQLDHGEFCEVIYIKNPTFAKINDVGKDLGIDANVYIACLNQ